MIVHVEEPVGGHAAALPEAHRPIEPVRPATAHLVADLVGIELVGERALEHRGEARHGGQHRRGVAVGLHDAGVGIGLEERVEGEEVRGRLQDPAPRRRAPLQLLEEPAVEAVGRAQVLALEPLLVCGNMVGGVEARGQEGGAHDRDALERELRPEGMDGLELGGEGIEPPELSRRLGDPRIGPVGGGLGRRRGEHDLPRLRHAAAGILGEEMMEQRAARAGKAHDEQRLPHLFRRDLRVTPPVRLEPQAIRELTQHVPPGRDPAQQREPRLALEPRSTSRSGSRKLSSPRSSTPVARRAASSRPCSSSETGDSPTRCSIAPAAFVERTSARSALAESIIVFVLPSRTTGFSEPAPTTSCQRVPVRATKRRAKAGGVARERRALGGPHRRPGGPALDAPAPDHRARLPGPCRPGYRLYRVRARLRELEPAAPAPGRSLRRHPAPVPPGLRRAERHRGRDRGPDVRGGAAVRGPPRRRPPGGGHRRPGHLSRRSRVLRASRPALSVPSRPRDAARSSL